MFLEFFGIFLVAFSAYLLVSTGGLFSEKSGTVNIGLDGTMIMGAFTYGIILTSIDPSGTEPWAQYVALLIVPVVGVLFSFLLSVPTINYMADHVVVGTAMNMVAPALTLIIMTSALQSSNIQWTEYNIGPGTAGETLGFSPHYIAFLGIALIVFGIAYYVLKHTTFGLRLKSAGENPNALAATGVNVKRVRYYGIMISGALAALGGAIAMPIFKNNFTGNVRGMGYIAIAIIIMSQWKITRLFWGVTLFAVLMAVASNYGTFFPNGTSVPEEFFNMLPYILPLITMMIFKSSKGPNSLGRPYNKEERS